MLGNILIFGPFGIKRDSLVAQTVKHLPAMQETRVQFLGWEDPLEKEMASHSCLENSMDGGAWWSTVHGVAESWTRLSNFTFGIKSAKWFFFHSHLCISGLVYFLQRMDVPKRFSKAFNSGRGLNTLEVTCASLLRVLFCISFCPVGSLFSNL